MLFVDENTGASDLAMDPTNPRTLFAGTWQIDIKTWGRKSGGPGSGVYVVARRRHDVEADRRDTACPHPPLGKIAVAVAPSDPQRVYALIETGDSAARSGAPTTAARSGSCVSHSRLLNERPHYYTRMLVMPDNANEVYFPSNGMGVTYDGGETTEPDLLGRRQPRHVGRPENPRRMMIGNDGGV